MNDKNVKRIPANISEKKSSKSNKINRMCKESGIFTCSVFFFPSHCILHAIWEIREALALKRLSEIRLRKQWKRKKDRQGSSVSSIYKMNVYRPFEKRKKIGLLCCKVHKR